MARTHGPVGVFVAVFDTDHKADTALKAIDWLERRALLLDVYDRAKVERHTNGGIEVVRAHDPKRGAKAGMAVGALIGLVFPPSILVEAAVGGAAGAVWGKTRHHTFEHDFLKRMGEHLQPGQSAIVVITAPQHMETLSESVPTPIWESSHAFETDDGDTIKEWIESLSSTTG